MTRFIDHLQIVTKSNYSAIANLHSLQISKAPAKSSQSTFTIRLLVTDLNNGDFQLMCSHRCPQADTYYNFKVKVTLRLAAYRQSVRLGVEPLETHDQRLILFPIEPLRS
jgi:hypothetical protein